MKPRLVQILIGMAAIGMTIGVSVFLIQRSFRPPFAPLHVLAEAGQPTSVVLQADQAAELASADGKVLANFAAGSVSSPLTVTLQTLSQPLAVVEAWRSSPLQAFFLKALDDQGQPVASLAQPFQLTLSYADETLSSEQERQLTLFRWDEDRLAWQEANRSCNSAQDSLLDTEQNQVLTTVCQFGEFALFVNSPPPWFSFLPLLSTFLGGQTLEGTVTDLEGNPIPGVAVRANGSMATYTDEKGEYRLSGLPNEPLTIELSKQGYFFPANGAQIDLTESNQFNFTALQQAGCYELIDNGTFEENRGWQILGSTAPASYSTALARNGNRSMRSGILKGGENRTSFSLFSQEFDIPLNTDSVVLNLWIYQSTTEDTTTSQGEPAAQTEVVTYAPAAVNVPLAGIDINYGGLFDSNDNLLTTNYLFWTRQNSTNWENKAYQLVNFDGRRVRLKIGTYNDGSGGVTNMFTDDVSLEVCVTPPDVTDLIVNGGFENTIGWARLNADNPALQPQYTTEGKHSDNRSMFAGVKTKGSSLKGYSPFEQVITIPADSISATLEFWLWTQSDESNLNPSAEELPPPGSLSIQSEPNNDIQYVAILDTNHKALQYLVWQRTNTQSWQKYTVDLSAINKTFILRFGVYNDGDGNVSSMFVDDVSLTINLSSGPTATPPSHRSLPILQHPPTRPLQP